MSVQEVRGASQDQVISLCNRIRRGDVLLVDLSGGKGRETKKFHPCVVVSNDIINADSFCVVVVPISSHGGSGLPKEYEVPLKKGDGGLQEDCAAVPHQIRTISKAERVVSIWGRLSEGAMSEIDDMLSWALLPPV